MDGLFIVFLVEKCVACQSHRKSNFGWIAFTRFPLLNAYYKEGSKKSQAILLAFRSYILTGKPELLLYLMFFFLASQSRAYFLRLVYAQDSDLTYNSISFAESLQIFKSLNIFWPQIQRKRSEDYNVFSNDFGCKKNALSNILASRFIWKYIANTRKPVET